MEQNHKQLFEAVIHSSICREFQIAFSEASQLPIAFHPPDSWQLPFHGRPRENPFCAILSESSRACARCLQMQKQLAYRARQQPATLTCWHGFAVTAVPIRVAGDLLGFLETGQVLRHPPDSVQFNRCVDLVSAWGAPVNRGILMRAYFRSLVVPPRLYAAWVDLLSLFAGQLSLLGSQIAVQQENAEPLIVRRAKELICERHTEHLQLTEVSRSVNSSPFYFCKIFKKITGQNFTAYVARVRVEKAKNLLLNPDVEISEIAFAVGFQSLTHFNRMFKALVHQTPTNYRQQVLGLTDFSRAAESDFIQAP